MLKKSFLISLILIQIFSMNGCTQYIKTPSDTMKSPQYSDEDLVFNDYKKRLRENKSPEELLKFLNEHIDDLSGENADIAVTRIIELQESLLPKYEEKALQHSDKLIGLGIEKELHDLPHEPQKLVEDAQNNGYKITPQVNIKIDYEKINDIAGKKLSEELKDYIKIESDDYGIDLYNQKEYLYSEKEYLDSILDDESLNEYLDELAKRINQTYIYIEKHKNSPYLIRIKELQKMYLDFYLFGSPNNPSSEHYKGYRIENNKISDKWRKNYTSLKNNSKNWKNTLKSNDKDILSGQFEVDMMNYVNILIENGSILDVEANAEISNIMTNTNQLRD